jgi:hypothetical protein
MAGKCIAVAVACAGMAAEPEKVQWLFSFPREYRVQYTCVLCWNNNCFFIMYFSLPGDIPPRPLGGTRVRKH